MSEALWAAALSPWLPVGEASDDELRAALQWARTAMRASVAGPRRVAPSTGAPAVRAGAAVT